MVDEAEAIFGWAILFDRDNERWFAVLIDALVHGKGYGKIFMRALKQDETKLNTWSIDHNNSIKNDGSSYPAPFDFCRKNGFVAKLGVRLESDKMSAVNIEWLKV